MPGLADLKWLFVFTHLMYLEYDLMALDCAQDALRSALGGVHGRKASSISILVEKMTN
jgi:hypothetical protein